MSVKRIVARTRSATGAGRAPVRNSSISSTSPSAPAQGSVLRSRQLDEAAPMGCALPGRVPRRRGTSDRPCCAARSWAPGWRAMRPATSVIATPVMMFRIAPGLPREPLARSPPCLHHVVGVGPEAQDARSVAPAPDDVVDDCVALLLGDVSDARDSRRSRRGRGRACAPGTSPRTASPSARPRGTRTTRHVRCPRRP